VSGRQPDRRPPQSGHHSTVAAKLPGADAKIWRFRRGAPWFGGVWESRNFFMQCPVVPEEFSDVPEFLLRKTRRRPGCKPAPGHRAGPLKSLNGKSGQSPDCLQYLVNADGKRLGIRIRHLRYGQNTDTTALFFRYDYFDEAHFKAKDSWETR
jgi:putative ABC transport system permease protein